MIQVALSRINSRDLFTFGIRIKDLIAGFDVQVLGIKHYVDLFLEKLGIYTAAIEKQEVSAQEIAQKDSVRDNYYLALRRHIVNYLNHPDAAIREQARQILLILNKDGKRIYTKNYELETAALHAIIAELDKNWLPVLDQLSATFWYNWLKTSQTDFETVVKRITEDKAENAKIAAATAIRKEFEEAIRKLFAFLELQYEMTGAPELADLMGQLQEAANRF